MTRSMTLFVLVSISACALLPRVLFAQSLDPALELIENAVVKNEIPGAAVLVMRNGTVVAQRAFGVCDRQRNRAFQSDTICWIASLTKPVTAAAAMTLVEQGKLDLDAAVESYLPDFSRQTNRDGQHRRVTVRQLMCHTSGIQASVPLRPQFFFQQSWYDRSLAEIVPEIAKTQLVFDPGTEVQYSNAAPYVLGRIVETLSGQPFQDYVQAQILDPLRMRDTGFFIQSDATQRAAVVYRKAEDSLVEFCRYNPGWRVMMAMPDGGLFSTPADMAKFANAFLNDGKPILTKRSADEMLSPQSAGYGLGWILDEPNQFSHWGSSGTLIWGDWATKTVGVVFAQLQDLQRLAEIHDRFRTAVTRGIASR